MKKDYDLSKLKEKKSPYKERLEKKSVGIKLSYEVIDYFKSLSQETGMPYQNLINLYLLDCARSKRKVKLKWE